VKKTTGNKSQKIPIGDTEDCYLLVNFDWEVTKHPPAIEEMHGMHEINEDEIVFAIKEIELYIANRFFTYLNKHNLSSKQDTSIENLLSIFD
jgi:hypothetical protein